MATHAIDTANRIQRSSNYSVFTPTNTLNKLPSCGAINFMLRLMTPVKIAYIEASICGGISLATSTLPESRRKACSSECVTESLMKAYVFAGIPKVYPLVSIIELKLPNAFSPQHKVSIVVDSASRKQRLYPKTKMRRVRQPTMLSDE